MGTSMSLKKNKKNFGLILKSPSTEEVLTIKGDNYRQSGQNNLALSAYNKVLKINPYDINILNNKALVLEAISEYEDAINIYDLIIKINPRFYKSYFNKGNVLFDIGKFDEAIKEYNKALEINPNYYECLVNKGIAIEEISDDKDGNEIYDYLLEIKRSSLDLDEKVIKNLERIILKKVTNKHYESFEIVFAQGELLALLKQHKSAIEKYDICLKLKPDSYFTYNSKGISLKKLGLNDLAIEAYTEAIRISPSYYQAVFNRANALFDNQLYEMAIDEYNIALQIRPFSDEAMINKKLAYDALSHSYNNDDNFEAS